MSNDRPTTSAVAPDGAVPLESLDLSLASLFVGYALADAVTARVRAAGHPDLRFVHGFVFQHLIAGPASVSAIAAAQGVTTQAVSQHLRELEDLGYVERSRDERDRRVRLVALTSRGRSAVATARTAREAVVADLAGSIGEDRVADATTILRDVLAAVRFGPRVASHQVRPPT